MQIASFIKKISKNPLIKALSLFILLLTFSMSSFAQTKIPVKGRVTDVDGKPIAGASILIKGTTNGVTSNEKGNFDLGVLPGKKITVSLTGYESKEITIMETSTAIDIQLVQSRKELEQVVVVGYGSQKKKDLTSAITTVDTKDISSRPIVNAAEALTGKAPGVQVTIPSGQPGSDLSIRVRGVGSPNGGEPLYVVDGVLANDIKSIDPGTIATISILKDASAAGIYGAAGSTNGVVMITTKQGTRGTPKLDVSLYTGLQQISKKLPVLNNDQWVALQTEINGTAPAIPAYYNLATTNNNWQDLIYHDAMQTGANVGLSGGSEKGTYYFGAGYLNQDGIMVGSNFDRYSVKLSVDQNATNWLRIGANISYNRTNARSVVSQTGAAGNGSGPAQRGGSIISALVTPEYIPIKMPLNAPIPGVYGYSTFFSDQVPLSDIYNNTNNTIANNLLGNVYGEIKLPFNIKYRSQFNVTGQNSKYDYFLDPYSSLIGLSYNGRGIDSYSETFRWAWDNTLTYSKVLGLHSINLVAGTSVLNEKIALSYQSGQSFASNAVQTLNGASSIFSVGSSNYEWSTNSYFGRLLYAYNDRYLLTATLRTDGSSRVGVNNRYGTFPAVSVGWKVSKENFMQKVTWIQDLKIRGGWGFTGNLPPYTNLYPSYSLLNAGSPYDYSAGTPAPGVSPGSQVGNPNLKWESALQENIGFDAGFFHNRVTVSADYYYKKVKDMIFTQQLPLTTGGSTTAVNLPGNDINKGFEFSIDAAIVRKTDFSWDMNFNMSFNNNRIEGIDPTISYQTGPIIVGGSAAPIYTGIIKNGLPLGTFWGYVAYGVDPKTGLEQYSSNMTNIGSALPKYTFGFSNTLTYKALSLSILVDGVHGNQVYDETRMETESLTGYANESASVLRRWEKAGDITDIPRALGNGTTYATQAALLQNQISSNYVEDGSFLRLRNATIAYQFKPGQLKRMGIANLKVFATGQNLFMITRYKGYSPELNGFGQGSNNQAVNAGAAVSLLALGIDNGSYPPARTYTIGVNIQL